MDGYERIINVMQKQVKAGNKGSISIVQMDSPSSCKINGLPLGAADLYISHHLKTGWMAGGVVYPPLSKGDVVAIVRMSDSKYLIIDRVVNV